MATDIIPIELGLPQGDLVTLWAPRWREEGEEWEAFLGNEEDLFAFPDSAHLAAFVRTARQHDLIDHPAWHVVPELNAPELIPDEGHSYDLVGVPDLVSEDPDTWTVGELAEIIGIVRSLADVCELDEVHEVLDSHEVFSLVQQGKLPFTGREGMRLWDELRATVAEKWDSVLDAIDQLVIVPDVDSATLEETAEELAEFHEESAASEAGVESEHELAEDADDEPATFWDEVGIDPIKIVTNNAEYYTLRCYLEDDPIFLGADGRIHVFTSPRALARQLANADELGDNELSEVSTWSDVVERAVTGELTVEVIDDNTYVLAGVESDLAAGVDVIDPTQLDLAVELLTDAADWADDDAVAEALAPSERLGWLVSFVVRPDPSRLAPSAPFDDEVASWQKLVNDFEDRLQVH